MRTAFFVVVLLGLDAWAIYKTLRSNTSAGAKALWSAVIVLLPLLGLVIWALAGPKVAKPEMYEHEPP